MYDIIFISNMVFKEDYMVLTTKEIEEIHRLRSEGLSYERIALTVGVTPGAIRYHIKLKPAIAEARNARERRMSR